MNPAVILLIPMALATIGHALTSHWATWHVVILVVCVLGSLGGIGGGQAKPQRQTQSTAVERRGKGYDELKAENDQRYAETCRQVDIGNQSVRYQAAAARESHRRGVRFNDADWEQVKQTADDFATRDVDRRRKIR